jgi:hypothetical protein
MVMVSMATSHRTNSLPGFDNPVVVFGCFFGRPWEAEWPGFSAVERLMISTGTSHRQTCYRLRRSGGVSVVVVFLAGFCRGLETCCQDFPPSSDDDGGGLDGYFSPTNLLPGFPRELFEGFEGGFFLVLPCNGDLSSGLSAAE